MDPEKDYLNFVREQQRIAESRRRAAMLCTEALEWAREDQLLGYDVEQMEMFPDFHAIGEYTSLVDEEQ